MSRRPPDWRTRIEHAEDRFGALIIAYFATSLRAVSGAVSIARRWLANRIQHAERATLLGVHTAVAQCCLVLILVGMLAGWPWVSVLAAVLLASLLFRPEWVRVPAAAWLAGVSRLHVAARWISAFASILTQALLLRLRTGVTQKPKNEKREDHSPRLSSLQPRPHHYTEADFTER